GGGLRQVNDHWLFAVVDRLVLCLFDVRSGVEIDLPAELDHMGIGVDLFVVDLEVHLTPRGRLCSRPCGGRLPASRPSARLAGRSDTCRLRLLNLLLNATTLALGS